ncbi:MAG: hypothetical protein KF802_11020 [Bdellovibrionaceae bacterium]|nr:hypothetical protein [Pseudobdellovibrionaceae bacterium]
MNKTAWPFLLDLYPEAKMVPPGPRASSLQSTEGALNFPQSVDPDEERPFLDTLPQNGTTHQVLGREFRPSI